MVVRHKLFGPDYEMPPRTPGTLSNGVLSLKFMQRGLSSTETPVKLDRAEIVDDSKWRVAHGKDRRIVDTTQKGTVIYEPSYVPFLYGNEVDSEDEKSVIRPRGRRTFQNGQEAASTLTEPDIEAAKSEINDKEASIDSEKSDGEDPAEDEQVQTRRKYGTNALKATTPALSNEKPESLPSSSSSKPQFLRPAGLDVPNSDPSPNPPPSHTASMPENPTVSRRDQLATLIASARQTGATSNPSFSTPSNPTPAVQLKQSGEYKIPKSISGGGSQRRKLDEVGASQTGPRKKAKRRIEE